jgi:hypothetical protein
MFLGKNLGNHQEFKNRKRFIGLIYGLVSGVSFAIFAWGIDAFLLAMSNAAFFWIKFLPGIIVCALAGSAAGWLTIYFENHGLAILIWGFAAILFTSLTIWLPTSGTELMLKLLNPDLSKWIKFSEIDNIAQFKMIGFLMIGLAAVICGLLEINLVNQVMLSSHSSSLAATLLICFVIFGLAGSASDYLINIHFREPVQALNNLIQTKVDYGEEEIPDKVARQLHLSAIRNLPVDLSKPRQLLLISFDKTLGNMSILVNLKGTYIKCTMIYSQASNCSLVDSLR